MSRSSSLVLSVSTQGAGALMSLVFLPLVARVLGPEAFGIVGLGLTFHALIFVLDGCNLMSRVAAEYRAVMTEKDSLIRIHAVFGAAEAIYGGIAILLMAGVAMLMWNHLPARWLRLDAVSPAVLNTSVWLIALSGAAKLSASFYRGPAVGLSDLNYSNAVSLVCYTLRFPVAYALVLRQPQVEIFLLIQLASFLLEAWLLRRRFLTKFCAAVDRTTWSERWAALASHQSLIRATFAMTALLVASGQADKVVLAKTLSLTEYGFASLAIAICAGIFVAVTPIVQVYMPGLLSAAKSGSLADSANYFRMMTMLIGIGYFVGLVAAFASPSLATILTPPGHEAAPALSRAFTYYGIGNGVAIVWHGIYWFHFAKGSLDEYRRFATLQLLIYFPALVVLAQIYGLDGAGIAWVLGNAALSAALAINLCRENAKAKALPYLLSSIPVWSTIGAMLVALVTQAMPLSKAGALMNLAMVVMTSSLLALAFMLVSTRVIQTRFLPLGS